MGLQIRQQTREFRLAAIHEATQNFMDVLRPGIEPQFADVWVRGIEDFDGLTKAEKMQMVAFFSLTLRSFQDAYYQATENRLDEKVWKGMIRFYWILLSTPGAARVWEMRKYAFSEDFQEFLDGIKRTEYSVEH